MSGGRGKELTITSPLAEDGDGDVAADAVAGGAGLEQGAVVPPALVGAVHLEVLLVLAQLHADPDAVVVAVAVVLGQHAAALVALAVDVQPARRLGQEPDEDDDDAGEEELQPHGDNPGVVGGAVQRATHGAGGEDGAGEPEGVVQGGDDCRS